MNITINCKGKFITDFHKLFRENGLTLDVIQLFRDIIYSYYKQYGRDFPFRKKITPYYVLISEIMLQQTQTTTVSKKFLNFIKIFSDFESLAKAPLKELLKAWQGLGYNRRALALKKIAQTIVHKYNGKLPDKIGILEGFPQIGKATASSIVTFAFNKPEIFIETNIRRVYIYFFFPQRNNIADKEILPIVEKTIDLSSPRKWYYALMDYGVMLKKYYPELNK
ncbi:MAG: A/G-specific adenine glycosylase, partial [Promethearchaeota archaeon]